MPDLNFIYMITGFLFAAYSVVANDSVQTLGTFINSQKKLKWYYLWFFTSTILIITLVGGWYINNGDFSFSRLSSIPQATNFSVFHIIAPLSLIFLTKKGVPVSTTFLVLSVFANTVVIEKMLIKSVLGYALAAVSAYIIWLILSKFINEHKKITNVGHEKTWIIIQWFTTGFLWANWLMHDMANIVVYLPRKLSFEWMIFVVLTLIIGLAFVFKNQGGAIQKIVKNKTSTRYIRSATIIDFIYAILLWFFKEYNNIPMSTSWVFVGLLTGREYAINYQRKESRRYKYIFPIIAKDFSKLILGMAVSVLIVLIVAWLNS